VREREGSVPNRAAAVSYRAPIARLQGGVEQFRGATRASGEVEGAIAVAGGDVFLANRIDDGFAVVDAGAAGVDVLHENRPIGKTDTRGKLLVPNLKSYQRNRLAIDPKALPVDAIVETTKEFATPPDRGAAVVRFGVDTSSRSALVSFRNTSGRAIPAGSRGVLESTGENFVVGYDGDAFLHKLETENSARIEQGEGVSCRARFSFVPRPGTQVRVGPVPCI
jgi:outer membrane usher protein